MRFVPLMVLSNGRPKSVLFVEMPHAFSLLIDSVHKCKKHQMVFILLLTMTVFFSITLVRTFTFNKMTSFMDQ